VRGRAIANEAQTHAAEKTFLWGGIKLSVLEKLFLPAVEQGVSLRSVKRIAGEPPVAHVDDAAEREKRSLWQAECLIELFR
jgi:hypothetical protein